MHQRAESQELTSPEMASLPLLGGALCLDFANTVDRTSSGRQRHEYLHHAYSLVAWACHVGLTGGQEAAAFRASVLARPHAAENAFREAIKLRRTIQDVFSAVAEGHSVAQADMDRIRHWYSEALDHSVLVQGGGRFYWRVRIDSERLQSLFWPVVHSAVDLLRDGRLERVSRCPGDEGLCGWLFLDTTRNRSRRWCSMQTCGSRDKMRRYYRRMREEERSPSVHRD